MSNGMLSIAVWLIIVTSAYIPLFAGGCGQTAPASTLTMTRSVSFQHDVKPIFEQYACTTCHGWRGGLDVESVQALLDGGDHGPAVIPGHADSSLLIRKVSPSPPFGQLMPRGGPTMADGSIEVVKRWINEGAKDN